MQAVILAAGRGTRMGAITESMPKPMIPILGKPLLEWKIDALPENITEVVITIGYLGEQIKEYFGSEWQGRKMVYVEQPEQRGTGASLAAVGDKLQDNCLVTMGDDLYVQTDLEKLLPYPYAILALHTKAAQKFGLLEIDEKSNLQKVTERPHGFTEGLVNTGAYMLGRDFLDYPLVAITETEYGLPQTLATMTNDCDIPVLLGSAWQPVGCPEDIEAAEAFIKKYYL